MIGNKSKHVLSNVRGLLRKTQENRFPAPKKIRRSQCPQDRRDVDARLRLQEDTTTCRRHSRICLGLLDKFRICHICTCRWRQEEADVCMQV